MIGRNLPKMYSHSLILGDKWKLKSKYCMKIQPDAVEDDKEVAPVGQNL